MTRTNLIGIFLIDLVFHLVTTELVEFMWWNLDKVGDGCLMAPISQEKTQTWSTQDSVQV